MDSSFLWSLIALQVFMGAFDTLFHHEGTERLAWRPSQKTELRLHGVRNALYGAIFLCIAWFEPHGVFAMALGAVLLIELVITLWDFVEEDLTRKLPGSERINHTLLAVNYGAILAMAGPYLWTWSFQPAAMVPVSYGWWSVMATLSAIGVGLFSLRDLLAAARSDRLTRGNPAALVDALKPRQSILITGGTGFIGQRLVWALASAGHSVSVVTRDPRKGDTLCKPVRVLSSLDQVHSEDRFDALINLAGEPVAGGLWTTKRRANIVQSRVQTTRALEGLVKRLTHKPDCLINGSAIGWYGLRGDDPLTEADAPAPAFTHDICDAWEQSARKIEQQGVRVVLLRIGLVFGVDGGMLAKLLTAFEFGGGGVMGDGRQWMSWIELDDLIRVIAFGLAQPDLKGPVNATAPNPVRNTDFTRALAGALNRPAILRFPEWLLAGALDDMGRETMLGGQRVLPARLLQLGFVFRHHDLAPMLRVITGAKPGRKATFPAKQAPAE
ncbi:TIGR01777 family oxidoreductase [Ruegeria meonggei]|uniref:TIGR01777 family oxidoreductase n=1 Tax=Ruegeria meonggei TaxID=1446476 RepID=UPI00366F7910